MTDERWMVATHARWQVLWVVVKKGKPKIMEYDFEGDLMGAVALYTKVKSANRRFATLRCANVGFPPPEKYLPYVEKRKVKIGGHTKIKEFDVTPMVTLNLKGIIWCPYCMQLRKPQYQDGFVHEGIHVPEEGTHCPICGVSHRDGQMRRWNPAIRIPTKRTRRSTKPSGRRTRRPR